MRLSTIISLDLLWNFWAKLIFEPNLVEKIVGFGLYFIKKEGYMDEYDFNEEQDDQENAPQDDGYGTYQDPDFDPDMPPDDDDDDDEEENGYGFLEDPDAIDSLSVAEVKSYAESIDADELNEDQQDGYEALIERKEQIDKDEMVLATAQKLIKKYREKVVQEKAKSPQAKQRLPKLFAYLSGTKALDASLKPIKEAEIKAQGKAEIKKVKALILKEIAIAQAQLAAEVAKDLFKLIPPPFNFIVLGVILALILIFILTIVIMIAVSSAMAAPYANTDVKSGKLDTASGIQGNAFYGVRLIYEDNEKAKTELVTSYENLVVDLITKIDEINGIDAVLQLNYTGQRPAELTDMIKIVADQTDGSDQIFSTLDEHLALIDHFGYTAIELENIKTNLLAYFESNMNDIFTIDTDTYTANFDTDYNTVFDNNYSTLNVTAPLCFVQDLVIDGDTEMVKGITQRNYVAMIYLPKTNVVIDETNFMFYMHKKGEIDNAPTNVNVKFKSHTPGGVDSVYFENIADASWWDDDYSTTQTDVVRNITMSPASYFDSSIEGILEGTSIYSTLLSSDKLHYNNTIVELLYSKVAQGSGESADYYTIEYLPNASCYYLQFEADGIFQFCEFYTEYHIA